LVLKTERLTTDTKPLVTIKGTKDGLLFLIDEHASMDDVLSYLSDLLDGENAKMFSGPSVGVIVDYGSRNLSHMDASKLLGSFMQKENFVLKEWGRRTNARQALFANRGHVSDQTIFRGTVRAGQQLLFEGDVVVIGDVNPGGEIQATGDVFVFGRLRGTAHAGFGGNERAIVAASEFAPMQVRIADVVSRAPEANGKPLQTFMEFAYLREGNMAVDKMKFFASLQ
jgi:septum site-determining protein MinC